MGVVGLWNIVAPLSKITSLAELRGQSVAIDLSGWIVDSKLVASNDSCPNKHLRNLFFRTSALLLNGINPVFVLEGKAPELKHNIIRERNNARKDINTKSQTQATKGGRGRSFQATIKQCQTLLKLMGLTCVQAEGEAEAMCSYLNADGLVDGVVSQDSDCFLYGAKKVYRNFTLTDKTGFGSSVEENTLDSIENIYGLGRNKMIALALLCGCDYDGGVPGVGKDRALQLLKTIDNKHILRRFENWAREGNIEELKSAKAKRNDISDEEKKSRANELIIRRKCLAVENFPNEQLIEEFLVRKGSVPEKIHKWTKPNIIELMQFMTKKVQWSSEYALEKIFPLLSRWQLENRENSSVSIEPKEIIKIRNIQSISYFEIEWDVNTRFYVDIETENEEYNYDKNLSTIEPQELVRNSYPQLVESFEEFKNAKKTRKTKQKPKKTENQKPLKNASNGKKKESKKINDFLIKDLKMNEKIHATKKNRKRSIAKLDCTVSKFLDALGEDDFLTDVEEDGLEMSMIVSKVCARDNAIEINQRVEPVDNVSPKRIIIEIDDKLNSKTCNVEVNDDDDDDDDIPYVPLTLRMRK